MASIVLNGDTSGSVTVSPPAVAGTQTVTLPAASGQLMVSGNMPAFSAYQSSNVSISSSTFVKVVCDTKEFDTNTNYNNSTGTFTPTVAGYYQVNATLYGYANVGTATRLIATIYKNGSEVKRGNYMPLYNSAEAQAVVSCIIYCNGSTDYVNFYGRLDATNPYFGAGQSSTWFQAVLVKAA